MERAVGPYTVSDDPARIDVDVVWHFLTEESYWARGVSHETVTRSIANSLPLGLYTGGEQVGFARVVTDRTTFAWLADVFVLSPHRGRGGGRALIAAAVEHPDLQGLRRWSLGTRDAHRLYEHFGFTRLAHPERFMERRASS